MAMPEKLEMKFPWRKNVLVLVLTGFGSVLLIFWFLVNSGSFTAAEAYELVQSPLMALIGGSLALAKDLIPLGPEKGHNDSAQNREDEQSSE